jgi:hypothetical protein
MTSIPFVGCAMVLVVTTMEAPAARKASVVPRQRTACTATQTGGAVPASRSCRKPDDAALLDLVTQWAPSETVRNRILVDNPQTLYAFSTN